MAEIALTCTNAKLDLDAEGTFHLIWKPGSTVSAADAGAVVAAVQAASGTSRQPLIVEVTCTSPL
mgnify:FL=1